MMKRKFFGLILILLASSIHAGDGVLEINAACRNSGCFAGDDPGSLIEITEPGSYRLTSNLEVNRNSTAIRISGDDVNLDLNGFAIRGPVLCTGLPVSSCINTGIGNGVEITGDNVAVRNGTIRGVGGVGISVGEESQGARINELTVAESGSDGISFFSVVPPTVASAIVRNVNAIRNNGIGISAFGYVYVIDSLAVGNGNSGISDGWCRGSVNIDNEISGSCAEEVDPNSF